MHLIELSLLYGQSAALLRQRIVELRQERELEQDPDRSRCLTRRITELQPMLREMRELQSLTRHYYDKGFCRNEKYTL